MRAQTGSGRVLRGDYETPDAVVVGLAGSFPATLEPLVTALSRASKVQVLLQRGASRKKARRWLASLPNRDGVELLRHEVDSPWVRDYGPLQVREADGHVVWLDGLYPERPRDDLVPRVLAEKWGATVEALPWSLDGGALASNGAGLCVTTEEYTQVHAIPTVGDAAKRDLLPALGCRVMAVVPALPDEPTHHVDLFVQFLDTHVVAVASLDAALDADIAARLDATALGIEAAAAALKQPLKVVRTPLGIDVSGDYETYLNGLHLPGVFLMPGWHDTPSRAETRAREALEAAMPDTEVVRIPVSEMTDLGGAIHCITLGLFVDPPPKQ